MIIILTQQIPYRLVWMVLTSSRAWEMTEAGNRLSSDKQRPGNGGWRERERERENKNGMLKIIIVVAREHKQCC